jgi:hypothetical protein
MIHAGSPARQRVRVTRRALVGAAWVLAWMLVWGSLLMVFAKRTPTAPTLTLAVSSRLVLPLHRGDPPAGAVVR